MTAEDLPGAIQILDDVVHREEKTRRSISELDKRLDDSAEVKSTEGG